MVNLFLRMAGTLLRQMWINTMVVNGKSSIGVDDALVLMIQIWIGLENDIQHPGN